MEYRQGNKTKAKCLFPLWEEVGPIHIMTQGLFTNNQAHADRELNEGINIVCSWVRKFSTTTFIPTVFSGYEENLLIAKHFSFYIVIKKMEARCKDPPLVEYSLEGNNFVGYEINWVGMNDYIPEERKLHLTNPGRIYKMELAPEDKFDYSNLPKDVTEILTNFPVMAQISEIKEHWGPSRTNMMTEAAKRFRAEQNNRVINPLHNSYTYQPGRRPEERASQFYPDRYQLNERRDKRGEVPTCNKKSIWVEFTNTF